MNSLVPKAIDLAFKATDTGTKKVHTKFYSSPAQKDFFLIFFIKNN